MAATIPPLNFNSASSAGPISSDGWMSDHSGFAVNYGSGTAGTGAASLVPSQNVMMVLAAVALVAWKLWKR